MEKTFELLYHDLERTHWWFQSRRKVVMQMAEIKPGMKILDIGCASGLLLEDLKDAGIPVGDLYGIDVSEEGIGKCQAKGFLNTRVMDGAAIDFGGVQFDVLIASDCLEHIENDTKALSNWYSLLKPEGKLVVFVPAFMSLWSQHDVINYHFRRYTRRELVDKATDAGFQALRSGYWNFFLFLPIFLLRTIKNLLKVKEESAEEAQSDLSPAPAIINSALNGLLGVEKSLLRWVDLPVGVSTYGLFTKK